MPSLAEVRPRQYNKIKMNRKIIFAPNNFYHIFSRGTEKRDIFLCDKDYERFIILLYLCNSKNPVSVRDHFRRGRTSAEILQTDRGKTLVDLGAYCLMPNHFHLLLREKIDNGITLFMKKLNTAYAMYFNVKNERDGNLFQGKFGAHHLDDNNYLKYIFAYIHLNPIKLIEPNWKEKGIKNFDRAKSFLESYFWSSYRNYITKGSNPILNMVEFPEYFESSREFKDFIDFWLNFQEK